MMRWYSSGGCGDGGRATAVVVMMVGSIWSGELVVIVVVRLWIVVVVMDGLLVVDVRSLVDDLLQELLFEVCLNNRRLGCSSNWLGIGHWF